jgi:hypothetical protein
MQTLTIHIGGIASNDQPLIHHEISCMTHVHAPELINCNEIIATSRQSLIHELKESGNKKMLRRVRSQRHEYYLLMFYRGPMTLKVVPLPYEVSSDYAMLATRL